MKLTILIFVILSAPILLSSCSEYNCTKADLRFGLIGFSEAEADTIILRRFDRNNNTPIDTFLLDNLRFNRRSDTLVMVAYPGDALMQSDYNYQVYFPAPGILIKITEIYEEQRSERLAFTDKVGCVNFIRSCKLNDQSTPVNDNDVYLKK